MVGVGEITFEDVVRAGQILFGPAFALEAGGWRETLRATYRRRAMQTHPDRAHALGRPERELAREFEAVAKAYRILSALRGGPLPRGRVHATPPPNPPSRTAAPPPPRSAERARIHVAASSSGDAQVRGRGSQPSPGNTARSAGPRVRVGVHPEELPRRRLRFAEYLYYSGRIPWTGLVEAVAWQRVQRPPLGRIAIELGFLAPDDVGVILERRREAAANAVPFGEWAVRLGYLTPFQLLAALGQQLRMQRPIGQFFVERGLLEAEEIEAIRRRILRHNARFQG